MWHLALTTLGCLRLVYIRKVHIWDTKSKGLVAYERRIARKLANTLTPLVESWVQKASGNNEILFEMLEREIPTRSNEEAIALRNLVTKTINGVDDSCRTQHS